MGLPALWFFEKGVAIQTVRGMMKTNSRVLVEKPGLADELNIQKI